MKNRRTCIRLRLRLTAQARYSERDHAFFAVTSGPGGMSPALDRVDLDDHHVIRISEPNLAAVDNFVIGPEGEFIVTGFDKPQTYHAPARSKAEPVPG